MPYVPGTTNGDSSSGSGVASSGAGQPSPEMLMMALAQMHKMGRLSAQAGPAGTSPGRLQPGQSVVSGGSPKVVSLKGHKSRA
jgi:hypothetical protein